MPHTALFAAGCFWGVQARFDAIPGVIETTVGYAGGSVDQVSYEQVCRGDTGHAEVVRVVFDPEAVSYGALLDAFFALHDPTQLNRQGPDYGTQYRSAVLAANAEQRAAAEAKIAALNASGRFAPRKVVTTVEPAGTFWPAEDYHQKYLAKRGMGSCHI
jgi:methionine-S-sulfoxide reductase